MRNYIKGCWDSALIAVAWLFIGVVVAAYGGEPIQQPTRVAPQAQCVRITVMDKGNSMSHGTATYLGAGLVVTVYHNVRDTRTPKVQLVFPQDATYVGTVIFVDKTRDICFVVMDQLPRCEGVRLRNELPEVGEPLAIQGYATGAYKQVWGTMSHRKYGPADLSHTWYSVNGAQARQGDSGGPVFDAEGRFVGTLWGSCGDYGGETQFTSSVWIIKKLLELGKEVNEPKPEPNPPLYKPGQKFAGRYHNRARTKRFFRRTS